jgi:Kef-type K+ transport system membrane component KefB
VGGESPALLSLILGGALLAARATAALFDRMKLPPLLGEITGGLLFGQILVRTGSSGVQSCLAEGGLLQVFGFVGLLMLLFLTGLETRISDLKHSGRAGTLSALGGSLLPLGLGTLAGTLLGMEGRQAFLLGVIMVPTSVGVPLGILMEKKALRSVAGSTILSAAILDDVLAVLLLTAALAAGSITVVFLKVAAFIVVSYLAGRWLVSPFLDMTERFPLPMGLFTGALVAMFLFSFLAEEAGLAGITGAFTAGLFIGRDHHSREIIQQVEVVGYGVFIPLFFVYVGGLLDPAAFLRIGPAILIMIAVAMVSKASGAWIGARLGGLSAADSNIVAVGMLPRLEVALIIVALATSSGMVDGRTADELWTFVIASAALTLVITPLLLNRLIRPVVKA